MGVTPPQCLGERSGYTFQVISVQPKKLSAWQELPLVALPGFSFKMGFYFMSFPLLPLTQAIPKQINL